MDSLQFMQAVLPSTGVYVIGEKVKNSNPNSDREYSIWHSAYTDIDSLNRAAISKAHSTDVFYCYGSTKGWGEKEGKGGKYKSIRFRENMAAFKSFVLDIDVDIQDQSKHATRKEALTDFYEYCAQSRFPLPSLIVKSGSGLHLYWVLENDITAKDWLCHAKGIAAEFEANKKQRKCFADLTRVADPAGLLRPVGTVNYKSNTLVEFAHDTTKRYTLNDFKKYYTEPNTYNKAIDNETLTKIKDSPLAKQFYSVLQNNYNTQDITSIVTNCAQIKYVQENQGDVNYGMWYAAMGVLAFVKNPEDTIKEVMGVNTGKFNEQDNLEKYNEIINNQTGPTSCAQLKLKSDQPNLCDTCPNKKLGVNPCGISIAKQKATEVLEVKPTNQIILHDAIGKMRYISGWSEKDKSLPYTLPHPYFEKHGFLHHMKKTIVISVDGKKEYVDEPEVFYPGILYPIGLSEVEKSDELNKKTNIVEVNVVEPKINGKKLTRQVKLSAESFSSPVKLKAELYKNKIFPYDGPTCEEALVGYLKRCLTFINANQIPIEHKTKLGWELDEDTGEIKEFVCPHETITSNGDKVKTIAEKTLLTLQDSAFPKPRGSLDEWVSAYACYAPYDTEGKYGYILSQVWGSVLMPFIRLEAIRGFLISLIGESGSGKSTIASLMMSSIGSPSPTVFKEEDTFVSKMTKLQTFNNLMMPFDELTNMEPEEVSKLAYSMAQGEGKSRANKDGELQGGNKKWSGVGLCSSNASLRGKLDMHKRNDTSAEKYRMFEIMWNKDPRVETDLIDNAMRVVSQNNGLAIPKYIEYLIANKDRVQKEVVELYNEIRKERSNSEERFFDANITVTILGHKYAKEAGLMKDYNSELIANFGRRLRKQSSAYIKSGKFTAGEIINDYYRQNLSYVIQANKLPKLSEDNKWIEVKPIHEATKEVTMRLEKDIAYKGSCFLYIAVRALRQYCKETGLDYGQLFHELLEFDIVSKRHSIDPRGKRKDLFYGLNRNDEQLRIQCIKLDWNKLNTETEKSKQREEINKL